MRTLRWNCSVDINNIYQYESSDAFFELSGSVVMKLSASAAIAVCAAADAHGLVIIRVEGGIWHHPGFEARVDCIWDGADPPVSRETAFRNNCLAGNFIGEEQAAHDTFILTALQLDGGRRA